MLIPKHKPLRDKKHLAFVRSLPCCVCWKHPCDAAHVRNGSDGAASRTPGDNYSVPLCRYGLQGCHPRQHRIGEKTFWGDSQPLDLAARLWDIFHDDWDRDERTRLAIKAIGQWKESVR